MGTEYPTTRTTAHPDRAGHGKRPIKRRPQPKHTGFRPNFQTGGKFQRWVLGSVILLTQPEFLRFSVEVRGLACHGCAAPSWMRCLGDFRECTSRCTSCSCKASISAL
jgi:hypothetical protein